MMEQKRLQGQTEEGLAGPGHRAQRYDGFRCRYLFEVAGHQIEKLYTSGFVTEEQITEGCRQETGSTSGDSRVLV